LQKLGWEKIISAIQSVEEYRLAIDALLTASPDSTPTEILDVMRAKENLIKQFKKVRVNAVQLPHGNSTHHCKYHSYNDNKSSHNTAECYFIKNGLVEESAGSQFLKLKSTQQFYQPPTTAQQAQYKLDKIKRKEQRQGSGGGKGGKGKEKEKHGGKRNNWGEHLSILMRPNYGSLLNRVVHLQMGLIISCMQI
jgi:hypothetical protein